MLTRKIQTYKEVPCEVTKFTWRNPVTAEELFKLLCSACLKPIGKVRWGIGFTKIKGKGQSMRLCEDCGIKAEQDLKDKP